jgi:hypothetical protein
MGMMQWGEAKPNTPVLHYSKVPISSPLLLPLQKFQPHPFGAFEKADPAPVG